METAKQSPGEFQSWEAVELRGITQEGGQFGSGGGPAEGGKERPAARWKPLTA